MPPPWGIYEVTRESTREATRPDGSTVLITEYNTTQRMLNKEHDEWVVHARVSSDARRPGAAAAFRRPALERSVAKYTKEGAETDYDYDDDNMQGNLLAPLED